MNIRVDHLHIVIHLRSQKELLIGGVKEITVRVEVENKAQDAAYPGKVIVTYPSVIDYVSSQVGRCEKHCTSRKVFKEASLEKLPRSSRRLLRRGPDEFCSHLCV